MQLQSPTASRLRRTTGRSLRGLADALRNRVRHQEGSRPEREQVFPGRHGDGMPATTGITVITASASEAMKVMATAKV